MYLYSFHSLTCHLCQGSLGLQMTKSIRRPKRSSSVSFVSSMSRSHRVNVVVGVVSGWKAIVNDRRWWSWSCRLVCHCSAVLLLILIGTSSTARHKECDQSNNEKQCDNAANNATEQSSVVVGRVGMGGRNHDSDCNIHGRRYLPLTCACRNIKHRRCLLHHLGTCGAAGACA
jgi:hypothetical protein